MDTITIPDCLRFKIVLYKNLIHNQKYVRRISKESFCVGIFKRNTKHRNKNCKSFIMIKNIIGTVYLDLHYVIPKICYFRICLKKHKIQEDMEIRAVNMILQKITGDVTFKY
jgi:hypothetical protein